MVPTAEWERVMSSVSSGLENTVLTSMEQASTPFKMKTVVVGLGLNAEVGITGVLTLGASARMRMVFCPRGQAPVVP